MSKKDYGRDGMGIIRGPLEVSSEDPRFKRILEDAARRPPGTTPTITTLRTVALSNHRTTTTVGLTKYSERRVALLFRRPTQSITFYSDLLGALSEKAATGVVAHELAHAWLNEHVRPEESKEREAEADDLARKWGFKENLEALDSEAETVN